MSWALARGAHDKKAAKPITTIRFMTLPPFDSAERSQLYRAAPYSLSAELCKTQSHAARWGRLKYGHRSLQQPTWRSTAQAPYRHAHGAGPHRAGKIDRTLALAARRECPVLHQQPSRR